MLPLYRVILPLFSLLALIWVIYNGVKRKLDVQESLSWVFLFFILFVISFIPELIDIIAVFLGIDYPPSLLFVLSFLLLILLIFRLSKEISMIRLKEKQLAQKIALLEHDLLELKSKLDNEKKS